MKIALLIAIVIIIAYLYPKEVINPGMLPSLRPGKTEIVQVHRCFGFKQRLVGYMDVDAFNCYGIPYPSSYIRTR